MKAILKVPRKVCPKRARSGYNFFFRAERARIRDEQLKEYERGKRHHRTMQSIIGFAQIPTVVAKRSKGEIKYNKRFISEMELRMRREWASRNKNDIRSEPESSTSKEFTKQEAENSSLVRLLNGSTSRGSQYFDNNLKEYEPEPIECMKEKVNKNYSDLLEVFPLEYWYACLLGLDADTESSKCMGKS